MNSRIINAHSNILLSDCVIKKIEYGENNISLYFDDYGIWKRKDSGEFQRERDTKIVYCGCDIDNVIIRVTRRKKFFFKTAFWETDLDFETFISKINGGLWKCQIIQEYYCEIGSSVSMMIKEGNKRLRCVFELEYKDMLCEEMKESTKGID